jgi:hypothetical protein
MAATDVKMAKKHEVYQFLKGLNDHLNASLPSAHQMQKEIREMVMDARKNNQPKHLKNPESALTNHFLVPHIFNFVSERVGKLDAQQCMLSEYRKMREKYCFSASPQRQERHPFSKVIADKPQEIMLRWKGKPSKQTIKSAPDLALRNPLPFNIVFEIKYFEKGNSKKAVTELVANLYQTFFYRALPYVPAMKDYPSWDYDYACLLACDASPDGMLYQSWKSLPQKVRRSFWEGANVYTMILRRDVG